MYRLLALMCIVTLMMSCEKLGEDYPYENRESNFSDAYEVSITLEPINQPLIDPMKDPVLANLQNGTSYTFHGAWGKGYEIHMGVEDSLGYKFKYQSAFMLSSNYSDPNIWSSGDPNLCSILFYSLNLRDENDTLYEAFRDVNSLNYILTRDSILKTQPWIDAEADTTDGHQYIYITTSTAGSSTESRELRGILKTEAITKNDDFSKIHLKGKIMYRH